MTSPASRENVAGRIQALCDEAEGVHQLAFYAPAHMPDLIAAALCGSREADRHAGAICKTLAAVVRPDGPNCLLCDDRRRGEKIAWIVIWQAAREDATIAISSIVCGHCADRLATRKALEGAVLAYYADRLLGDIRLLPPMPAPGHA